MSGSAIPDDFPGTGVTSVLERLDEALGEGWVYAVGFAQLTPKPTPWISTASLDVTDSPRHLMAMALSIADRAVEEAGRCPCPACSTMVQAVAELKQRLRAEAPSPEGGVTCH